MKKLMIVALAVLIPFGLFAQQADGNAEQKDDFVNRFVAKYSASGVITINEPGADQTGKQMPLFNFDKQLNSEALKGKVLVLDFWATWCSGCLVVSHGLDSLIAKEPVIYQNVQVIGVNCQEKKIDKGYNAREYWKKTGKSFPMVDGPAAEACGLSVKNGFPTVIVVDDHGIIRRRWDGAGPLTANAIRVTAWQYAIYPTLKKMPVTVENGHKLLEQHDWISALYFFDQLPETDSTSVWKLDALLHVSEAEAAVYAKALKERLNGTARYDKTMFAIAGVIARSQTEKYSLILTGLAICDELQRKMPYASDFNLYADYAQLHYRYAQYEKDMARRFAEQGINMAKSNKASAESVRQLEELLKLSK